MGLAEIAKSGGVHGCKIIATTIAMAATTTVRIANVVFTFHFVFSLGPSFDLEVFVFFINSFNLHLGDYYYI